MTLALLITAVGGAWAQDPVDGTIAWSVGNEASATVSASIMDAISSTGVTTGSGLTVESGIYFETNMVKYTPKTANAGNVSGVMIEYRIETANGFKFKPTGVDYAAVKVGTDNLSYSWSYTIDGAESAITDVSKDDVLRSNGNNSGTAQLMHSESITADGCSVFTLRFYISNCGTTKNICIGNITISGSVSAAEPDVEVTTNAAEEGATFTEASFTMPQNDVTVTYTLKRDMAVDMAVTVQDAQQNSRFRVQKQGNNFVPVGLNMQQVLALFNVHDDIENTDLTLQQDYYGLIFSLDDDDQPTGDGVLLANFNFAPGRYAVRAIGQEGSNYVGTTEQSNVFTLYQGYPVDVAAQSFATYYSDDEALTLEESFAETAGLYTVASVTATEAVLSEKIDVMPKRTPMLIYNESETAQQILLIPTADVAPLANVADEFKGTAVEKEVTAEEVAATNFYVLTDQNQFVWVKDAGTIAAHRCWLEIAPSEAAGARRIVFSGSGTTGIDAATLRDITTGDWYDLNGRKINMPTKKGVYIFNGKKVVIK